MAASKNRSVIAELMTAQVAPPSCDEYERMVSGMPFDIENSPRLVEFKYALKNHWDKLNDATFLEEDTLATMNARRMKAAKDIFGKLGENVFIEPGFSISWGCNTFIGSKVYINRRVSIYDDTIIKIGDNTLIGPDVVLCAATPPSGFPGYEDARDKPTKPITIESDCWIGARAIILPGVTIGQGSTVAACAVVAEDVKPRTVVGGRPAKLIKSLTEPSTAG